MKHVVKNQKASFGVRVTGLPSQTTRENLLKTFSQSGNVTKCELTTRGGKLEGRVHYSSSSEMYEAVWALHDSEIHGKKISVTLLLSNPRDLFDLYITGHPPDASKNQLREMINNICQVKCIRITNKKKFCFLQIHGYENVTRALSLLDGAMTSEGSRLNCQLSKKKTENPIKQLELAQILNQICKDNNISSSISDQDMHILEKSLRTFHLSGLPMDSGDEAIRAYFEKFGEVENCARIVKDNFSTAYGFVVFKSHRSSDRFRVSGDATMLLDSKIVKIAPSRPTKEVNDIAKAAGLLDYEKNPTSLLYSVLSAALESYEGMHQYANSGRKEVYLQDPSTGLCYKWETTEQEYARYIDEQIRIQAKEIEKFQKQQETILSNISKIQCNSAPRFQPNLQATQKFNSCMRFSPY